jgi:hypothetical protein
MQVAVSRDPGVWRARVLAWSWLPAIIALAFHAANGVTAAALGTFPVPLDELQHLSFVREMERTPQLLPRYEDLRVLTPDAAAFTTAPNPGNHPAPYYLLMGLADHAVGGSIPALRAINLLLSLVAVAVLLAGGFQLLKSWRERAIFAAALVLFPKLGVVAGLINNDNAALLAVGCAFLGLVQWQTRPSSRSAALLAAGLALCGWTKFTVLLMLAFGAGFAEIIRLWQGGAPRRLAHYGILACGLAVGAVPNLANLAAYGRLLPHTRAFYVPLDQRVGLDFAHYALRFFATMANKWPALELGSPIQQWGLWVVLALGALVLAVGLRGAPRPATAADGEEDAAAWRVACGLILATAPVLLLHLYFGWRTFLEDGFLELAQARYYYGVWPGFALGFACLWRRYPHRLRAVLTATAAVLLASESMSFLGLVFIAKNGLA